MVWWKEVNWSVITGQVSGGRSGGLVQTTEDLVLGGEVAHQALEVGEALLCRTQATLVLLTSLDTKEPLELLGIMFGQMDLVGNEVTFNKLLFKNITENTGERSFLEPLSWFETSEVNRLL